MATPAGYSGTPLSKKLGIKPGSQLVLLDEPSPLRTLLEPVPTDVNITTALDVLVDVPVDVLVAFFVQRGRFEDRLGMLAAAIYPNGACWVAWPKRASKVPTDLTEDVVREVALPIGLVDNKVCAINDTWSGLRLVWRKEHRRGPAPPTLRA
ncbi:MAG: DUF3052 domain-containing protein [Acidimicrobiales bacterium]